MEVRLGLRVVRGPDWMWGEQDGGEGNVGTVVSVHDPQNPSSYLATLPGPCVCTVQWDSGPRCRYRCGVADMYDLRVLDCGPAGIQVGADQCTACQLAICGMKWKCKDCPRCSLCTPCYMLGRHGHDHNFERIDSPKVRVSVGSWSNAGRRVEARGCYLGAKVTPSHDWDGSGQRVESCSVGNVIRIVGHQGDHSRSHVEVEWVEPPGSSCHKLGWEGMVELKCLEATSAGYYYPDQLPNLGQSPFQNEGDKEVPEEEEVEEEEEEDEVGEVGGAEGSGEEESAFKVGDYVRVELEQDILKDLQEEGGAGSNPPMLMNIINIIGRVEKVKGNGHLRVSYYKPGMVWTLCPQAVVKVDLPSWELGQLVRPMWEKQKEVWRREGISTGSVMKMFEDVIARVMCVLDDGMVYVYVQGLDAKFLAQNLEPYEEPAGPFPWPHPLEAASKGTASLRTYLQQYPGRVNQKRRGRTELHVVSLQGDVDMMKTLLEFKADVECPDSSDIRPLHYAIMSTHSDAVQLLLRSGADVNSVGPNLRTPLIMAVERGLLDIVDLLVNQPGLYINGQDSLGHTALHIAVLTKNLQIVRMLLEHGADPKLNDFQSISPLMEAAQIGFAESMEVMVELDKSLVNHTITDSFPLLHMAVWYNQPEVVKYLVSMEECEVDYISSQGLTPLHVAVSRGLSTIVELLVEHGANPNMTDSDDNTPLHMLATMRLYARLPTQLSPNLEKMCQIFLGEVGDNVKAAYMIIVLAGYLLRKGTDMHKTNKEGLSALKAFPFLANVFTIIAENEHLFSEENSFPGGLLEMYGGCKLVYPDKTTKSTEHMHYCRHCRRHHHHHHQDSRGGEQGGHLGEVGLTEQHAERDSFYGDSYYGDSYYGNTGESADYGDAYGSYSGGYSTNYGGHGEVGGARTQEGSREFMGKTMMMFFSGGTPSSTSDTSYATTTTYSQTTDTPVTAKVYLLTPSSSQLPRATATNLAPANMAGGHSSPHPSSLGPPSIEELRDEEECYLCDSPANVRFSPCGHTTMCSACAPRAKKCPICRKPVEGFLEL